MKRGISLPLVRWWLAAASAIGLRPWSGPAWEFASVDEAIDFFADGADGFELYEGCLFCPDCLLCGGCDSPVPAWVLSAEAVGGQTLLARQCAVCGLFVEVLA